MWVVVVVVGGEATFVTVRHARQQSDGEWSEHI